MDQTINFGMNNFQNANNNMNQINNNNGFNNSILNQYTQINPMLNQMTYFSQDNPFLNQINTFNQNNPMINQMTNYNKDNPLLNQMNTLNQNNPILNQMNTNPVLNQMANYNQGNPILNQMNILLNQMNSYDQNNPMLNMDIFLMNQIMDKINKKMDQINEINKKKIKKEMIQNINLNNLNKNQIELINSIIEFYKENGNEYMDFNNPYQIKNMIYFLSFFLSLNDYKLDVSDNIEDPLDYIEEKKKIIKFINSDYKKYKVKIPLSITKYDLYSIAQKYKCFKNNNHSNILLINNNLILNRDETSIDSINENDIIIIIEPRNFPDDSYYKSLQERTEKKGNIYLIFSSGMRMTKIFPDDIKIYEIYKSINLELGLDINTYHLLSNGEILKINDQRKGSFLFNKDILFVVHETLYNILFGKIVMAKIIYNNNCKESEPIGILNSIKDLKGIAQTTLIEKKIKKLKIETKVIKEGDNRSLFSLGVKNNFTCFVEHEE